jgi:hypothetical protein
MGIRSKIWRLHMRYSPKEKQLKSLLQELLKDEDEPICPVYPDHSQAVEPWKRSMAGGTLTGKVYSAHTVENYARYADEYLAKYPQLTFEDFKAEMEAMSPEMFGRKDKSFKAIVC